MPLNVKPDLLVNTVRPVEHSAQLLAMLQRMQVDAQHLFEMAQTGEYDIETVMQMKRDIQRDMEAANARLVFTCNDLQSATRGIPVLEDDEEDAFGG